MSVVVSIEADEHGRIQALLPWYARGQLSRDERDEVRDHLDACPACRAELDLEAPLRAVLASQAVVPPPDPAASLARLHAQIDRHQTAHLDAQRPTPTRFRWMPLALGLQTVALASVVGLWVSERPAPAETASPYVGLSAPAPAAPAGDALVIFRPDTTEAALRSLLQAQQARIVSGPTKAGAYLLQVQPQGLAGLQASPLVQMAAPLRAQQP
ncbi:anti-sigma factor [Roseateles paludis]|uniref:Anti-sigma factor n=1 Tax=Roseateles paludis TaxID=3145238 RepID=A0ABV0G1U1_9BURK